jgi:RNA polymerase sigma-70 factor, ECF subfamily
MSQGAAVPCLMQAWADYEQTLRGWLRHQIQDRALAEDLLQDVFLKAMRQGQRFCNIANARAWLFEVTRNALADHLRARRESVELPEDLAVEKVEMAAIDGLTACLPRVLSELSAEDRDAITCCDLQGMSQADYAVRIGVGLSGAKSRVQRARARLKQQLSRACQVRLDTEGRVCDFTLRGGLTDKNP